MRSIIIGMWKMYFLFGVLFIIASQSGVSAKASCRKVVNDLILPSHTKLVQNSKSKDRFRNVILVCENGYFFATRISTTVIKCKNGVILTNPIPKCGGCGVPGNISDGTVTFTSTAVKSQVTYSCDVGFTLVGKRKRKCRQRLKWSGREPSCKHQYSQCGRAYFKNAVVLDHRARIVGGATTKEKLWPWAVRIYIKYKQSCGGTLINQEFVLTAASCLVGVLARELKVAFGDKHRTTYTSLAIHIHPQYDRAKFINDIALVKIPKLKRYSRSIQTICLPRGVNTTHIIKPGNNMFAVGWGTTKRVDKFKGGQMKDLSKELKQVEIPFINDTKCADNVDNKTAQGLKDWHFSSDTQFCAGDISGQNDTCQGDCGAPAMVLVKEPVTNKPRWYQIGIASWGHGCAQAGEYGYYSKVSPFLDWVDKQIKLS